MAPVKMAENAPSYIFRRKAKNSMFPLETKARDISIIIVEILEIPKPISNKFYPSKITRTLFYDTRTPHYYFNTNNTNSSKTISITLPNKTKQFWQF